MRGKNSQKIPKPVSYFNIGKVTHKRHLSKTERVFFSFLSPLYVPGSFTQVASGESLSGARWLVEIMGPFQQTEESIQSIYWSTAFFVFFFKNRAQAGHQLQKS